MSDKQTLLSEDMQEKLFGEQSEQKFPKINDEYRQYVTERVLKNQIDFSQGLYESDSPTNQTGGVQNFDPVLISMVRRSTPNLMAFDLAGVQPMTGPTGSIFAMRARYDSQTGTEALHDEANSAHSGVGAQTGDTSGFAKGAFDDTLDAEDPAESTTKGTGMSTNAAQNLGSPAGDPWKEMAFSIERADVSVGSRKLKAQFSNELAYDLKNIHGLDASTELAKILSTEIKAEIDRELLRTINISAVLGAQTATTPGRYDLLADSDGRWMVERFKGLIFQIELEANRVSIDTRRGRANRIVASANVVSLLNMAGVLDYNPALAARTQNLQSDPTMSTFAGVMSGRYQVFIDPYASVDYVTVGYRGANAWDAGIYYCPYLPMQMYRATGENNFHPKIGFETRYGIIANPFARTETGGAVKPGQGLGQGENVYYRKMQIANIQG